MNTFRSHLIDAYRWSTMALRKYNFRQAQKAGTVPCMILFYHRVADEHPNPWTMSNAEFDEQITWMQENFDMVSLEECQNRIRSGHNTRPTLSITFDDGYADNCNFALPMLIKRNIPVTYFVTTHHTTNNQPFPHDIDRGQPLAPNTIETLKALASAGIEIGGHTRTHPDLASITDPDQLFDEVITATRQMESLIGKPIRYFAFPFGRTEHLNPTVFKMLKENGILGVCTTQGGVNDIGGDTFNLQRIHGDPIFARMKNWLSGDPRLQKIEKYDWENELDSLTQIAKTQPSTPMLPPLDISTPTDQQIHQ